MKLQDITLEEFVSLLVNDMDAVEQFYRLSHGEKSGNTISLLFNPHRLDTQTSVSDGKSIFNAIHNDKYLNGLARLYLYNLEHGVNKPFYRAIERGFNGVQYVNEFPPFASRDIILKYNTSDSDKINVLDPCCGWGGRMIGCASIPNTHYFGYEPSTQTFEGLMRLGNWLQTLNPSFEFTIYNKPYEDAYKLYDNLYDVALTSPPYFNTEIYSSEETNSMNRYTEFDLWVRNFYEPLIVNTMNAISESSSFVVNVSSRRYPLFEAACDICDNNGFTIQEINSYLSGGHEKFYVISKHGSEFAKVHRTKLF